MTSVSSAATGPPNATIDHYEVQVQAGVDPSPSSLFERIRTRLFAYDIFPPRLVDSLIWPSGRIDEGAMIVQRVRLGPVALEMAVRVIEAWDFDDGAVREAGFTYATIVGHPERGIETFRVRLQSDGRVMVVVDARSRPGILLTRLGYPAARLFQRGLTESALRRLARS